MPAAIIAVNVLMNRKSKRTVYVILGAAVLYVLSNKLYSVLFPYVDLSLMALATEARSTGGGYNISRLGAFWEINEIFFQEDVMRNLFGYGFGSCELSGFSIFTSDFYREHGHYHYQWFIHQHIFLETGYVGVFSYLLILASCLLHGYQVYRDSSPENRALLITGISMGLICCILFIYNATLRTDYAYILFFTLSISAVVKKSKVSVTEMGC